MLSLTSTFTTADAATSSQDGIIDGIKNIIQSYKDNAPKRKAKRDARTKLRQEKREKRQKSETVAPAIKISNYDKILSSPSLLDTFTPRVYKKRDEAFINIALVYYGENYYSLGELDQIGELLKKRFYEATGKLLSINIKEKLILPFRTQIQDQPEYELPNVIDPVRLQRIWYYDNVGMKVAKKVFEEITKYNKKALEEIDFVAVVTGAQFDGLGFHSGAFAVTENPMEVAWGGSHGGRVDHLSDEKVVDELIHELGHSIGLDHASKACMGEGISYQDMQACCEKSPNAQDVMSYCRKRTKVDEKFFYGFKECNLKTIKEMIIPKLLNGETRSLYPYRQNCE